MSDLDQNYLYELSAISSAIHHPGGRFLLRPLFFKDPRAGVLIEALGRVPMENGSEEVDPVAWKQEALKILPPGLEEGDIEKAFQDLKEVKPNIPYYLDKLKEYAERSDLSEALEEARSLLEMGRVKEGRERVLKGLLSSPSGTNKVSWGEGIRDRLRSYLKRGEEGGRDNLRLPTGIVSLDNLIRGGLGPGEVGVIVALPKGGKSTTLVNIGKTSVLRGKRVLHVSLENSKALVEEHYDKSISGMSLEEIRMSPKEFCRVMKKFLGEVKNHLHVEFRPSKAFSVSDLMELVGGYIGEGWKPDLVIVDYASLLQPSRRVEERRFELIETFELLRKAAGVLQVPIWTAHQANRASMLFDAEKKERGEGGLIGMENVAEAFEVMAIVDLAISANQSARDKRAGLVRYYVMANRLGPSLEVIPVKVSWPKCLIWEEQEVTDDSQGDSV